MKKEIIPSLILTALAAVLAAGSQTFLSPCVHEDGSFGACHWAGRTLAGLSCVLGVLAALSLCAGRARLGTYLSALPVSAMGILTPGVVIGLCPMSTMRCRMVMQPAMRILFSAALLFALAGAIACAGEKETK